MKKILSTLCLLLTFGLIANQAQAQVDLGIRGGVNLAIFNNTDLELENTTGFMVGIYLNYHMPNSPVTIQPEVLYTQKGATVSRVVEGNNVSYEYKLDYITIPVLAKFDYVLDGPITPHVYLGPYIGFNINAEQQVEIVGGAISEDFSEEVKNIDFGVVVGAGIDVSRFSLGFRYSAGLTPVFEDENADAKNGVISIVAGFNL